MTLLDEDRQWPASSANELAPVVAVINKEWSMRAAKLLREYLFVTGFLGARPQTVLLWFIHNLALFWYKLFLVFRV
jgi:hypothetical protein